MSSETIMIVGFRSIDGKRYSGTGRRVVESCLGEPSSWQVEQVSVWSIRLVNMLPPALQLITMIARIGCVHITVGVIQKPSDGRALETAEGCQRSSLLKTVLKGNTDLTKKLFDRQM